jgi:hypothetical protein
MRADSSRRKAHNLDEHVFPFLVCDQAMGRPSCRGGQRQNIIGMSEHDVVTTAGTGSIEHKLDTAAAPRTVNIEHNVATARAPAAT